MENEDKLVQMRFLDINDGLGNICESDWTKFAKEKNVYIHIGTIAHRNYSKKMGVKPTYPADSQPFMRNSWTDMKNKYIEFGKLSIFDYTIQKYKNDHQGTRPDWAKLYSEKSSFGVRRILTPDDYGYDKFRSVEKEIYFMKDKNITVLRFAEECGYCQMVLLFQPGKEPGYIKFRQEEKISKAMWKVTKNIEIPEVEVSKLMDMV